MGLVDQIRKAASWGTIEELLETSKSYKLASPKTARRWKSMAARRLEAMKAPPPKSVAVEKSSEKPKERVEKKPRPETKDRDNVVNRHKKYQKT